MSIEYLLDEISERKIAIRIGIPHDEARLSFPLRKNTVDSFEEFNAIIADYYNHHFTTCVSRGGSLSLSEAASRAKVILEQAYRKRGGDIAMAINDAHDGTGGLRAVLDIIADGIKAQAIEYYIRDAFDRHVAPNSWEKKVSILRKFIIACGPFLSSSIRADQPERYAQSYKELIQEYSSAISNFSRIFRRL